ncbi:hypothetical protein V3W47_10475 [Deinococcus sp. YIM 134068]|uniref:hypothetical protein n=1 Tax=Deinococcus lichenicola TaxID=3118910 RepID=UPI002F937B6D
MVLREISRSADGALLTLRPRGGGDSVIIERDALRPFLFGKDVERWHIDWQGWWVVFPYLETEAGFKLMPTAQYRDHVTAAKGRREGRRVFAGYPADFPNLEAVYPHLWAYLNTHEAALRGRENGKYRVGREDEWRWYDLARPQSLEASSGRKIVMQLLGRSSQGASDTMGNFFQAGGKGGGAYGVQLLDNALTKYFATLLSSHPADFFIKTSGIVYSGGYYSYADAYIRDLPIPASTSAQRDCLSRLARELTALTGELRGLEVQARDFPDSVSEERRGTGELPELDELGNLAQSAGLPQRLEANKVQEGGESLLGKPGEVTQRVGKGTLTLGAEHARLVREVLAQRRSIGRDELLALRVPERGADVRAYLDTLAGWRTRMAELRGEIGAREAELNDVVYNLYGLTTDERAVVERFLERF